MARARSAASSKSTRPRVTEDDGAKILSEVAAGKHDKVRVAGCDIDGVLRGKYMHRDKFLSAAKGGFGFCNVIFGWDAADVCYDNTRYTGWHSGYPDVQACIDRNTFRRVPWDDNVPFFLADFVDDAGADLPICPRRLLRRIVARANDAGFSPNAGMEFEWFNFKETPQSLHDKGFHEPQPISPGMFGYSLLRTGRNLPFFNALQDEMQAFGVPIEGLHTETGPGVLEAAVQYSNALEAADRAVLFKWGARDIGARFEIMPSFMAKWNSQLPGCSGHIHLSLAAGEKNAFHDAKDHHRMSGVFKSFLAGVLTALPEILPMFAPTVNSYKRLVEGYWAPTRSNWGVDNRTVAMRVIPGSEKSTRLELRVPGSDCNPYLAMAAGSAAGIWGVEQELSLAQLPVRGSGYADKTSQRLPRDLNEAQHAMSQSELARTLFGDAFVDHFTATREWEWRQYSTAVTNWELKRYFEII